METTLPHVVLKMTRIPKIRAGMYAELPDEVHLDSKVMETEWVDGELRIRVPRGPADEAKSVRSITKEQLQKLRSLAMESEHDRKRRHDEIVHTQAVKVQRRCSTVPPPSPALELAM